MASKTAYESMYVVSGDASRLNPAIFDVVKHVLPSKLTQHTSEHWKTALIKTPFLHLLLDGPLGSAIPCEEFSPKIDFGSKANAYLQEHLDLQKQLAQKVGNQDFDIRIVLLSIKDPTETQVIIAVQDLNVWNTSGVTSWSNYHCSFAVDLAAFPDNKNI